MVACHPVMMAGMQNLDAIGGVLGCLCFLNRQGHWRAKRPAKSLNDNSVLLNQANGADVFVCENPGRIELLAKLLETLKVGI